MTTRSAIEQVRNCIRAIKPDVDVDAISDDTALLEDRVITSFDVLDLILHLEQASGRAVSRTQLVPGSFRDIRSIARVFLGPEDQK